MRRLIKRQLRNLGERAIAVLALARSQVALRIMPGSAGFFGEVFCTINGLRLAEQHGLCAHIGWGPQSLYFDGQRAPDGNAREGFFAASRFDFRNIPPAEAPHFSLPFKPGANDLIPYEGLDIRQSVSRALQRWCQPHPDIALAAQTAQEHLFTHNTMLGVHIRLTDAAAGKENRSSVPIGHFLAATDHWLEANPDSGIFLATDEVNVIQTFFARYGAGVRFQSCLRSTDGTSIHGHYDKGLPGSAFQKGAEVFIDALLLPRCNHLIRAQSRVTASSLCWAPELSFRDLNFELTGGSCPSWICHQPIRGNINKGYVESR